jgi:hypothetical protein
MKNFLWSEHGQDFWGTHLDEAKDKSRLCRDLSPKGEFLKMPEASPRWVKNTAPESGKGNFSGRTN